MWYSVPHWTPLALGVTIGMALLRRPARRSTLLALLLVSTAVSVNLRVGVSIPRQAAAIAVMQQLAPGGPAQLNGAPQRLGHQRRRQRIAHGPADDLAAEQVDDDRQVNPPGERRPIGNFAENCV